MQTQYDEDVKKLKTWKRIFLMLFFFVIAGIVRVLVWIVILLQLFTVLFSGYPNSNILSFGRSLSAYMYHLLMFLTFNTDKLPFPFSPWRNLRDPANLPKLD